MKKTSKSFEFDYEEVKNKALEQLKTGRPLLGKGGALAPLFKSFLEAALEAELESHLQENGEKRSYSPIVVMDMGQSNCGQAKGRWNYLPLATEVAALSLRSSRNGRPY
jgi:hypothetical protein